MMSTQQHIIRKVIVDVEAKSEGAAFRLKDTIDVFLKEEVFPSLERYFESLEEELQSETIQISQLTLDVKSTSDHNFKDLKEAIKKQVIKEFQKAIKSSDKENENVAFLSSIQNKERALIYFLEKGIPPWWNGAKNNDFLQEKTIVEVSNSTSFIQSFREKIKLVQVRDRLINQFSDAQIQSLLYNVFKNDAIQISIVKEAIVERFKELTPQVRKFLWKQYINYFLIKDEVTFLTELLQYLPSDLKKEDERRISEPFLEVVEFITLQFDDVLSKGKVVKGTNSNEFYPEKGVETITNTHLKTGIIDETGIDKEISEENTSKAISEKQQKTIDSKKIDAFESRGKENSENDFLISSKDIGPTSEGEVKSHSETESITNKEAFDLKTNQESTQEISKEIRLSDEIPSEKESELESKINTEFSEELEAESIKEIDVIPERSLFKEETAQYQESTKQKIPSEKKEPLQENEVRLKTISEIPQELGVKEESHSGLLTQESNELKEEFIEPEEKGEYYIENAGLIIVHPYLKDFFINCDLLNDENKITNPELAIHLLHYIATKKEKQFESNMIFEKFLCGFPIQKSIRREVAISKELKQKSEDFLEAVIANWTALNNASPDLLRNEFLQRSGKISFKEINPRIVVERKVHDILLDKIPWTLSICKLPWMNKLIFTDW